VPTAELSLVACIKESPRPGNRSIILFVSFVFIASKVGRIELVSNVVYL
jgi:hypothetical protein